MLSHVVKKYEEEHYPIEEPDLIWYIKIRMDELGLGREDRALDGVKGKVAKVLNRSRSLSIIMIRKLHKE